MIESSDLPPTQKGRHHEIRAAALREFAGLRRADEPLDPFKLAEYAGLAVPRFDEISGLSPEIIDELLGKGKHKWSGGAASRRLPNGKKLIILNPTHSRSRHKATLMEEICHVFLGHKPSRLAIKGLDKHGNQTARDYHAEIEEEAYGTGAAALVPYTALKDYVAAGKTAVQIARHFGVSRPLVEYRIKISRLWDAYKSNILKPQAR